MTPARLLLALLATLASLPLAAQPAANLAGQTQSASLQAQLQGLAARARPGVLGVTVLDLNSGLRSSVNADQAYPMMSMFKAPVAAAVLSRIDAGKLTMEQQVTIARAEVDPGSAVPSIGDDFQGERMTFTVRDLLKAAVSQSDNTAVDALIRVAGGPEVVTAFLRAHAIAGMRIDEDERQIGRIFNDLGDGAELPASETPAQQQQRRRSGYERFLQDPRNRSTPDAAAEFLKKLWQRQLLSPASTEYLLSLMYAQTIPHRLRDGLPPQVRLADKTGTGTTVDGRLAAYNDVGILTWPDGHTVIVAAFLMDSTMTDEARGALFADIARATVKRAGR